LLYLVGGRENDQEGGDAFEYLPQVSLVIQNYIAKDPKTFMSICPDNQLQGFQPDLTFAQRTLKFVGKILLMHEEFYNKTDGLPAIDIILAMLENTNCREIMQVIVNILLL
jgi:hypothetical protein